MTAQARRPERLMSMGFSPLPADLADPATHAPAFWAPHLPEGCALMNAAGLLTGTEAAFAAVHRATPTAALRGPAVLIPAIGVGADTLFARWRRETEALFGGQCILRPGLVLADTSYGGSSLLRALAALPVRVPVVGTGDRPFNPIHAADLAAMVEEAGLGLAHLAGWGLTADWLLATCALYVVAFAAWAPVVWLQYRIRELARAAAPGPLPRRARRLYRWWVALGWPGFGALVGIFWLMVSKPDPLF